MRQLAWSLSLAAALVLAACPRDRAAPNPGRDAAVAERTVAGLVTSVSAMPADALTIPVALSRADGQRLRVRGFLWLFRPTCKPCPVGAACEPCPLPYFQIAEHRNLGMGRSQPGTIMYADMPADPQLDVEHELSLLGRFITRDGTRVLAVESVTVLAPAVVAPMH